MTTINRAPFNALVDDDGSNLIGTNFGKSEIQGVLLDPIDAALATLDTADNNLRVNVISNGSTGALNDFAPGLVSGVLNILRMTGAADFTISGFSSAGMAAGTRVRVINAGSGNGYFPYFSGSAAGNKLINYATSGPTPLAAGVGIGEWRFDAAAQVWRLDWHEQGDFIDYGAISTIVGWSSRTTTNILYKLSGRSLTLLWQLSGTSNSTLATFTIPYTTRAIPYVQTVCNAGVDNGANLLQGGLVIVAPSGNVVQTFSTAQGGGWTASALKQTISQIIVDVN